MSYFTKEEDEYFNFISEEYVRMMLDNCVVFYDRNSSKMNDATRTFFLQKLVEMRSYYNEGQISLAEGVYDEIKNIHLYHQFNYIK